MSDDEDDPFERLDESVGDREGDPFEHLGDVDETGNDRDEDSAVGVGPNDGNAVGDETEPNYDAHDVTPADHLDEVPDARPDEVPNPQSDAVPEAQPGGNGEQSEFVEQEEPSVESGATTADTTFDDVGTREGDPFEDDVFKQMDVGEVDPDDVWESIAAAEDKGSVSQKQERVYAAVSKHSYCEQCEFFSDPPDVRCSHDGTEILEFLDQETVRVVDCPVVAEREELAKHE